MDVGWTFAPAEVVRLWFVFARTHLLAQVLPLSTHSHVYTSLHLQAPTYTHTGSHTQTHARVCTHSDLRVCTCVHDFMVTNTPNATDTLTHSMLSPRLAHANLHDEHTTSNRHWYHWRVDTFWWYQLLHVANKCEFTHDSIFLLFSHEHIICVIRGVTMKSIDTDYYRLSNSRYRHQNLAGSNSYIPFSMM